MDIACPSCRAKIPIGDINVSTDVALCRACGRSFHYSQIVEGAAAGDVDLTRPPSGVQFERTVGGFRLQASTRSWMALFFIPFTCAWSGMSLSGIYGGQIAKGAFSFSSSLFGLPFLIGTVVLLAFDLMYTAGQVVITAEGDRLQIFTGVLGIGWRRSYRWSEFSSAREDFSGYSNRRNQQSRVIALEGQRRAAFGSLLSTERRYFVLNALRTMLNETNRVRIAPIATFQTR